MRRDRTVGIVKAYGTSGRWWRRYGAAGICLYFASGASGSGKTTLLRVIAGFEAPDRGRVLFGGRRIDGLSPHQRGIGFVFQNFALFPHLSVAGNIAFGLEQREKDPCGPIGQGQGAGAGDDRPLSASPGWRIAPSPRFPAVSGQRVALAGRW